MANYPASISTDANLYIAVNNKRTQLNGAIDAVVTTITVDSTTGFPSTGLASIDTEIFSYTSVNATQFLGVTRGFDGTSAASHVDDSFVNLRVVAAHHNNLKDEVIAIETALGTNLSNVVQTTGTQTIAGAKTFTDPITQNDTSNQLVLGVTNTTTVNVTAPSASRIVTIPDPGANASFVMTEGTQTINGIKTFSASPIVPVATTATQAVQFSQVKVIQFISATTTTATSTTSTTFTSTALTASITPTSASNKVMVLCSGDIRLTATSGDTNNTGRYTLDRSGANIGNGAEGFGSIQVLYSGPSGSSQTNMPLAITFLDSPATTSSITYTLQIRKQGGTQPLDFNVNNSLASIILVEVVA